MELVAVIFQKAVEQVSGLSFNNVITGLTTAMAITSSATAVLSKKTKRKFRWQLFKNGLKGFFHRRKGEGKGAGIVMLLLLLIAGAAILWILWELTGVFGLILGLVGGIALLSLIFSKD